MFQLSSASLQSKRVCTLLVFVFGTSQALASGMFEVVGAMDSPYAHAARVMPAGGASAYFNPALLTSSAPEFGLALMALRQELNLNYDQRPKSADITANVNWARLRNPDGTTSRLQFYPLPTDKLRNARGSHNPDETNLNLLLSTVYHVIPYRLVVGLYASLPLQHLANQSTFYSDEREQYFSNSLHYELLEDRLAGSMVSLAVGYRPWDWLSVGLGLSLVSVAEAQTFIFIPDASDQEVVDSTSKVSVDPKFVPHIGLAINPIARLRITGCAHLPIRTETKGMGDLQFWNYTYPEGQQSLIQDLRFSQGFSPLRLGVGIAWQTHEGRRAWQLGASLLWANWEAYRNRHQQKALDGWSNTWSLVLAAGGWMWNQHWALELFHVPSPVPKQDGRTSYVDNDRTGVGVSWRWPFVIWNREFSVSVQCQLQHLWYQRVVKSAQATQPVFDEFPDTVDIKTGDPILDAEGFQTNNPGWPGYASDGWLIASAISFKGSF